MYSLASVFCVPSFARLLICLCLCGGERSELTTFRKLGKRCFLYWDLHAVVLYSCSCAAPALLLNFRSPPFDRLCRKTIPNLIRHWVQQQHQEGPTRAHAGSTSAPGDVPSTGARNGGASGAADGTGSESPTTSAADRERNALVLRIALHLKGARMLVAVASRLDTPTTAAAATAAAAAAATSAAQSKREAQARRETSAAAAVAAAGGAEGAAGEVGMEDDFLYGDGDDEEDAHGPDAEVLPRDWKVTNNAPVYLKNRASVQHGIGIARESAGGGGGGGVNSPSFRRNENKSSLGPGAGSPYTYHDPHGGGVGGVGRGKRLPHHVDRNPGQGDGGGGGHDGAMGARYSAAKGRGSSAGVGAVDAVEDHGESWSDRGHEQQQQQLRWREITQQSFDLILLVDTGKELGRPRVLLSMPEYGVEEQEKARREGRLPGGLYICPTMAEYFLLLSVYFGESGRRGGYCSGNWGSNLHTGMQQHRPQERGSGEFGQRQRNVEQTHPPSTGGAVVAC